jgi:AraC-like DNA-binding protein
VIWPKCSGSSSDSYTIPHYHYPGLLQKRGCLCDTFRTFSVSKARPPRAWLYRTRVERARKYLLSTDLTVAEVSEQSGFRDVSHFSRTFRAVYGSSPGRYRTEHR